MTEKTRIAIIAGQLVVGGAERQLFFWLANMDRDRFNVIVLTLHPGHQDYWEKPIEDLGIQLYRIKHRNNRLWRLVEILSILRPYQPDIIHGWHMFASAYAGAVSRILGSKSIGGIRSSFSALEGALDTRLSNIFCDAIVSNSETAGKAYQEHYGRKKQPVFTVHNAINSQFHPRGKVREHINKTYKLDKDSVWIASIGRMDPLKRFDLLVQLVERLKSKTRNFHCLLIGDGPEKNNLEEMSCNLEVQEQITFTGEIPSASQWMKGFDILCFPSIDEGLPNVIMEAAAAGIPVAAWQMPFIEELLENGKMALLAKPLDLTEMEEALKRLICSPDLRQQLGIAAKENILSKFSLEQYIQAMSNVYASLL